MSTLTFGLSDEVRRYLLSVSVREPETLARLREETAQLPMAMMQITPEQGQLMALLVRLLQARRCLEVGTFTGYSALWVALALPADGRLTACDVSAEWTAIGRRYWEEAGVAGKIDLQLAPALETLDRLISGGESGQFDFAFIDADKSNYWNYYERTLRLLRPGGLIAIDNTLWSGRPADADDRDATTSAIRDFNARLYRDRRVHISMLPVGDGVTLVWKPYSEETR
jgi:predicted O-methyltransferase YrrM